MDHEWTVMPRYRLPYHNVCMRLTINTIHIYGHTRGVFLGFFFEGLRCHQYLMSMYDNNL